MYISKLWYEIIRGILSKSAHNFNFDVIGPTQSDTLWLFLETYPFSETLPKTETFPLENEEGKAIFTSEMLVF